MKTSQLFVGIILALTATQMNSANLGGQTTNSSTNGRMPSFEVNEKIPDFLLDPRMFLEPIPAYDTRGYIFALYRTFFGHNLPTLSMVLPATMLKGPETAVLLYEESSGNVRRWFLEHAVADARIDDWKISSTQRNFDRGILATRIRMEISQSFAAKLISAWSSALSGVRVQPRGWLVFDGSAVFFQCGDEFGQAKFPGTIGAPAKLTELGSKLRSLPRLEPQKQIAVIDECIALADDIIGITKTL